MHLLRRVLVPAAALALLLAAAASAQAPDEGAAARAFAAAAGRVVPAITRADVRTTREVNAAATRRACRPALGGRHSRAAATLLEVYDLRRLAERLRAPMLRFRGELADAQTRDPALLSGRAAWRQLGRALAALPAAGPDPCASVAAWRRGGFPPAVPRAAQRELDAFGRIAGAAFDRKTEAARARLIELGVPQADAQAFSGDPSSPAR
ncbi:MAG: hypothetical protein QOE28_2504 [Solirubrobacteraceae bacterium]|nr:hypothetical protein [Solirubrobacteraceae bacterium]